MILSTLRRLVPYRLYCLGILVMANSWFVWKSTTSISTVLSCCEIVPGATMPDAAMMGYTPQQALAWYDQVATMMPPLTTALQLGLLDLTCIIPSYTILLGAQLVATKNCPEMLCHVPIWTAMFDIIETATHFAALLARYNTAPPATAAWTPSMLHLIVASAATQFKFMGLGLSLALVAICAIMGHNNNESSSQSNQSTKTKRKVM